jgi:hypothetical protein
MLAAGCGEDAASTACGANLAARVEAVVAAGNRLSASANQMRTNVRAACTAMAQDLGETVPAQGAEETDDEYLETVCGLAAAAIQAEVTAGAVITVAYQPPRCTVDAQAQFACESSCDVSATCDPGTVEVRCEPGELSVVCEGTCDVNAYCEAEGSLAVNCEGVCEGVCDGTCSGSTNAAGECAGTCSGSCHGSCQIQGEGGIDCGASARCRGGCTGTYQAPRCHAELTPPGCDLDADCQAGCTAQGNFNADCTPGYIAVHVEGGVSGNLEATLEANLPALILVAEGLVDFFEGIVAFGDAAARVSIAVSTSATCIAAVGERIAATVEAAASALLTVSVSVTVSVEVNASAGVGP